MKKTIILLLGFAALFVFICGVTSELYLGDESYHYRFAKDWFGQDQRPLFDSIFGTGFPPGFFYTSEILWPMLLQFIWKIIGGVSFIAAQFYHTAYFVLLLVLTYLLARKLYDKTTALYSVLIIMSVPMVVLFSIVFYLEIPLLVAILFTLLMILKRNYLGVGLGFALLYFTKRSGLFFVPLFSVFILLDKEVPFQRRMYGLLVCGLLASVLILPDIFWRETNFKSYLPASYKTFVQTTKHTAATGGIGSMGTVEGIIQRVMAPAPMVWKRVPQFQGPFQPSLLDPGWVLRYFGPVFLFLFLGYLVFGKERKKDRIIIYSALWYFLLFIYFFGIHKDIRYLIPVVPMLSVLGARFLATLNRKWVLRTVAALCLVQFVFAGLYVNLQRKPPVDLKEGFSYIKNNTAPDSVVLYPGHIFLEKTGRKVLWSRVPGFLHIIFWADEEKVVDAIGKVNLDYIFIDKQRIYDDTKTRNVSGYPVSFVERIKDLNFLEPVFENERVKIFRINRERLPGNEAETISD